ncbi:MAG: hypothetical protein HOK06_02355 [Rhodospirillaceae bacterium]|nr:hypothetical protein [Rhodospirillaceae bacterium]MBT6406420.1 hypothetical protein [Rhodospirillaceae bacterium]
MAGEVLNTPPSSPDPTKTYLFYMHGRYIEKRGPDADYRYASILEALAKKDLIVIGEVRGDTAFGKYAAKIVSQARSLLEAGVPVSNITVAGHSKGGFISLIVSTRLGESSIKYGVMAACGVEGTGFRRPYQRFIRKDAHRAKGRFLVAWEQGDTEAGKCDAALDKAGVEYHNEVLTVGGGHRLFYEPEPTWIKLLADFALSK